MSVIKIANIIGLFNKEEGEQAAAHLRFVGYDVAYAPMYPGLITGDGRYLDKETLEPENRKRLIQEIIEKVMACDMIYTGCYVDGFEQTISTVKYRSNMPNAPLNELGLLHAFFVQIIGMRLLVPEQLTLLIDGKAYELGVQMGGRG